MTTLVPDKRRDICGGLLAPANLFTQPACEESDPPSSESPDYVSIECLRPYYWSENPPRSVMAHEKQRAATLVDL